MEMLKKYYFDLIICDYLLPDKCGDEIVRWVRRNYPLAYVLGTTGEGEEAACSLGWAGVEALAPKSDMDRFEVVIKSALEETARRHGIINKFFKNEGSSMNTNKFHKKTGITPYRYQISLKRLNALAIHQLYKKTSKEELAAMAGYASPQKMHNAIKDILS
jgi:DNA-binding NarL/FixJ family response regulator